MLFKMLWIERTFLLNSDGAKKPRQIFVTQSRVLAGKVEEYFVKLLQSLATVSQTPERLKRLASSTKSLKESPDLVDVDDDVNWRSDLPQRFSELLDKHFPLFTTFDRVSPFSLSASQNLTLLSISFAHCWRRIWAFPELWRYHLQLLLAGKEQVVCVKHTHRKEPITNLARLYHMICSWRNTGHTSTRLL